VQSLLRLALVQRGRLGLLLRVPQSLAQAGVVPGLAAAVVLALRGGEQRLRRELDVVVAVVRRRVVAQNTFKRVGKEGMPA
jgi:hypothetical protein